MDLDGRAQLMRAFDRRTRLDPGGHRAAIPSNSAIRRDHGTVVDEIYRPQLSASGWHARLRRDRMDARELLRAGADERGRAGRNDAQQHSARETQVDRA